MAFPRVEIKFPLLKHQRPPYLFSRSSSPHIRQAAASLLAIVDDPFLAGSQLRKVLEKPSDHTHRIINHIYSPFQFSHNDFCLKDFESLFLTNGKQI